MKKIVYRFKGSDQDKTKFIDPEPDHGVDYSAKNLDYWGESINNLFDYFEIIEIDVPEPELSAKEVLSSDQRLKILELVYKHDLKLEFVEKYVAFGIIEHKS